MIFPILESIRIKEYVTVDRDDQYLLVACIGWISFVEIGGVLQTSIWIPCMH